MGDSWRGTRRRTLHQRVARRAQFGYPCSTDVGRVGRASGAGSSCRPSRRRVSLRCPRIQLRGKRTSGGRTGVPRRISGGGGAGVGGVRVRGFRGCRRPALMSAMTIGRFPGPDAGSRLRIAGRRVCRISVAGVRPRHVLAGRGRDPHANCHHGQTETAWCAFATCATPSMHRHQSPLAFGRGVPHFAPTRAR